MSGTWWVGQDELDDDQKKIIALPESESALVTGPPGSGKTNLLLLRANYLYLSGLKNIVVVTFTRSLCEFIASGAFEYEFPSSKIVTNREWQNDFLHQYGAHLEPTKDFEKDRQAFALRVKEVADNNNLGNIYDAILLDEAQDYTPEEIELFDRLSSRLFCVADERQKIYNGADPLDSIRGIVSEVHELRFHYRNGKNICRVADEIAQGWHGYSPLAEFSNYDEATNPSTVNLQQCSSLGEQIQTVISRLKTQLAAFPNEYIGILCPKKEELKTVWEAITSSEHGVSAFLLHGSSMDRFPAGKHVVVTTFHAAKGLEFRTAHLIACESLRRFGNNRKMAFTAVTRTKTALSVYHTGDLHGYLEAALQALKPPIEPPTFDAVFGDKK